jgi:Leucine-rich repeat (LRR) protein
LKELSTLEELDISGTSIEDINDLKYNSKLTNLNIKDTLITDISVLKNLPSLSKFCFGGAYSGAYFPHDILTLHPEPEYETKARELSKNLGVLKECNSLTSLEIGRPNYIEKAELDYLRLPKLVHFSGAVMNNYDFLIDCISLKSAYIYSINFNCPLKVFKNCTQMTKLTVEYCDDRNVDELLALENLEELVISGYSLEDISALSELRSFKKVVLGLTSRAFRYDQLQELDSKGIDCY